MVYVPTFQWHSRGVTKNGVWSINFQTMGCHLTVNLTDGLCRAEL